MAVGEAGGGGVEWRTSVQQSHSHCHLILHGVLVW